MRITFGISEIFAIGAMCLYQSAFIFSMVLLALALVSKLFSYGTELAERKKEAEAAPDLTDNLLSAIQLKAFSNDENGYH